MERHVIEERVFAQKLQHTISQKAYENERLTGAIMDCLDALDRLERDPAMQEAIVRADGNMILRMQVVYPRQCAAVVAALSGNGEGGGGAKLASVAQAVQRANDPHLTFLYQQLVTRLMPPNTHLPSSPL